MILVPFALAWIAFAMASNLLKKFWQWLVVAVITFAVSFLVVDSGNDVLIAILGGIFACFLIVLFIARHLQKQSKKKD